ncbi:MAG: catalase [Lachnospiraceae bacterium]|nr:catalase [Lachnospiraceae bacterium]
MNSKLISHFMTITRHKLLVTRYCFRLGLFRQGILHDLSKYSPTEFLIGVRYFQGHQSPNNAERKEKGYSLAWLHHKGRNKHHYEYWIDTNHGNPSGIYCVEMPLRYVAEMFCDRVAACRIYQGDACTDGSALEYFLRSKDRLLMNEKTKQLLESLLTMLRDQGEARTFAWLKQQLKQERSVR